VSATTVSTKKKKDDKDTAKSAVRARFLMEKYGTKWRSKVAAGAYWCFHTLCFHRTVQIEGGRRRESTCAVIDTTV